MLIVHGNINLGNLKPIVIRVSEIYLNTKIINMEIDNNVINVLLNNSLKKKTFHNLKLPMEKTLNLVVASCNYFNHDIDVILASLQSYTLIWWPWRKYRAYHLLRSMKVFDRKVLMKFLLALNSLACGLKW